jgi:hypothetical protein
VIVGLIEWALSPPKSEVANIFWTSYMPLVKREFEGEKYGKYQVAKSNTYLDELVPTSRDNNGVGGVGGEADSGGPFGVTVLDNVHLALTQSVPELDGLVTGGRDDLTVVRGEGDREDIAGVANKAAGGGTIVQVPETESLVPGSGQSELTVRGDGNVLDEVVVASKGTAGDTVVDFVTGQVPDDQGLVYCFILL